jgi:dipeptidase D
MGCEVVLSGSYPGWTPNTESEIMDVLVFLSMRSKLVKT